MARARLTAPRDNRKSEITRGRIIEATVEVIRERGFIGATTAAIAERAEVNQGVIFYHFGTLTELFSETLHFSSSRRLDAYRRELADVSGVGVLLQRAGELFAEDVSSGHVTVLAQLVAGAGAVEALRPTVLAHVEQWVTFVESVIVSNLTNAAMAPMLPAPHDVALLVVSLYLGAELLLDLAPGLGVRESLDRLGTRLGMFALLAGGGPQP